MDHQYKKYFSLVEMLVIFAVLVVLASLLSSSLKSMSFRANQVICFGNLRSMGQAVSVYLGDNNDTFMDHRRGNTHNWHDHLLKLGLSEESFLCPERGDQWESRAKPGTYLPVVTKTNPGSYLSALHFLPYGYNGFWLGYAPYGSATSGPLGRNFTLMSDIKFPHKMITISDSNISVRDTWASSIWYRNKFNNEGVSAVHQFNSSILFVDGHASSEDATEVNQNPDWDPFWKPSHD